MKASNNKPITTDLVLIGGGHSHVHVLKQFGMHPMEGLQITVISNCYHTPYSGMLPGYLSGHYSYDDIHLNVGALARFCGARLVHAKAIAITTKTDNLVMVDDHRPPIRFDLLSINTGISPQPIPHTIPVKPIAGFCQHYEQLLNTVQERSDNSTPYQIAIVGGGAGGVEVTLSLHYRLSQQVSTGVELMLLTQTTLLTSHSRAVQVKFERILRERGIRVVEQCTVTDIQPVDKEEDKKEGGRKVIVARMNNHSEQQNRQTRRFEVDAVLSCVSAKGGSWLAQNTPFQTSSDTDCLIVTDTLQLPNYPHVFCAGDCAEHPQHPRPKAGVFAVRAGPILYENLVRYLTRQPLQRYIPQRDFLGLIATGNQYAVASKGRWLCLEGAYLWKLKDYIDRTWMAKYRELPDMTQQQPKSKPLTAVCKEDHVMQAFASDPMRCGGCGSKVGSTTVSRVLRALYARQVKRAQTYNYPPPPPIDHDDAAITPVKEAGSSVQTIDYFREMINDPYIFGKIVAVHSLSDIHAMGVDASTALVLAVAPYVADEDITESTLLHMMSGISDVLQDENVRLVGGHTCEGLELSCGLSVQGHTSAPHKLFRKRGGMIGDKVVLTKPLGTGALFAAEMRGKGEFVEEALAFMTTSSYQASCVARNFDGVHACTDVTGFGFMGHLLEMLLANDDTEHDRIGADLYMADIPFYKGGLAASAQGIYSSLQGQNERNRRAVANHSQAAKAFPVEYPLLFDPQTAGGLLFFVDSSRTDAFVKELASKNVAATTIGVLESYEGSAPNQATDPGVCTVNGGVATARRVRIAL